MTETTLTRREMIEKCNAIVNQEENDEWMRDLHRQIRNELIYCDELEKKVTA